MAYQEAQARADQPVWVGTIEDVKYLVGQVEELAKYVQDKRVKRADGEKAARREKYMARRAFQMSEEQQLAQFEANDPDYYLQFDRDTTLSMAIKYKQWEASHNGTPAELFEKPIDIKDVKSIHVSLAGSSYATLDGYGLSVSLSDNGATASIKAPEEQFLRIAASQLDDAFKRQRPWYWWFRKPVAILPALLPTALITPYVFSSTAASGLSAVTGMTFLTLFACITMSIAYVGMRFLARPFELVKEGAKGRSARQLAVLGSSGVFVLGSVAIPLWLQSMTAPPAPQPTQTVYVTPAD